MKKNNIQPIISIVIVFQILFMSACGSDGPSAQEIAKKAITSSPWKVQSVTVDGTDQTAVYSGLTITFTETGFTATNGGPVWPATGTWNFSDGAGKEIVRGDGLSVTVTEATQTRLVLKLTWSKTTLGPGRESSVSGENTFTFAH
jgi:hypothetical protein